MAAFPPLNQICGNHGPIYEAYYRQVDPKSTGSIGALDAATFMKKSGLKDVILSQIWDMSDPTGRGYLEKPGFYVALKLIALTQNSQELNVTKITTEAPPPNLGPYEILEEVPMASTQSAAAWDIKPSEKSKYDQVFDSLGPINNMLNGDKVKPVLLNSKLPVDILGRIWELSDIDRDGFLDRDEFAVAMHLVYRAREGDETPMVLPVGLIPPSKQKPSHIPRLPGAVPVLPPLSSSSLPGMLPIPGRSTPTVKPDGPAAVVGLPWVVTSAEKINADTVFRQLDTDQDGMVTGAEIRETLAHSGLPTGVLAHIWTLCDIQGTGKLNAEQFALAMHLIQLKLKGIELPPQLLPEMIPPSLRTQSGADPAAFGVRDGTNAGPYSHVADFSAIKELDNISKEIDDIKREKLQVEREKLQYDADVRLRQGEVTMLQKELDAVTSTLTQLESQKKEAQKRLDELDDKKSNLDRNLKELRDKTSSEQMEVNKMKSQISNQERLVQNQETELDKLKQELQRLKEEEQSLEQQVESSRQQLNQLSVSRKDITSQLKQTKAKVQELQNQHRELSGGDPPGLTINGSHAVSEVDRLSSKTRVGIPNSPLRSFGISSETSAFKDDPFKGQDPFNNVPSSGQSDPFHSDDPFKDSDPFKSDGFTSDPFASDDPFKDAFTSSSTVGKKDDPFASSDPFASAFSSSGASQADGFDAFGSSWTNSSFGQEKSGGDPFGGDPFAPSSPARRK
ncbi:epidermal growth factor receptor substrate 15-like 1 isoform X1 [Pomacea canaliculata]|uniref:epidermal growth factor receptor substrate 15-like 1 isoform X1 n=2 Tax=Pomacea canaliculata TaxID=400727 RepID=UPI000D73F735|nr:epidermal growth factor receptor substrate 15-like 1 isoform X1 [Pomacea canaliculata]